MHDVGCFHSQTEGDAHLYAKEVERLLRPGGHYVLFARLHKEENPSKQRGTSECFIRQLFASAFQIEQIEYGLTETSESPWPSAWFWMRRGMPSTGKDTHATGESYDI